MGRNIKYNAELKINICRRYLNGESATLLANEYGVPHMETIIGWVRRYEILKDNAFTSFNKNKAYSAELKRKVIAEVLKGNESIPTIANKYNITSKTIVIRWVKKYNKGMEIKDYNPKGDVYTMKSRKTTFEERLEIVNYVLANDYDYKGAADKYTVSYASVYNWVKKYNEFGEDSLKDSRGRPSSNCSTKELTLEEKQAIEIEKLKNELKRKDMVIEVLKKNIEIQERLERDSRSLNKRTNTKR